MRRSPRNVATYRPADIGTINRCMGSCWAGNRYGSAYSIVPSGCVRRHADLQGKPDFGYPPEAVGYPQRVLDGKRRADVRL